MVQPIGLALYGLGHREPDGAPPARPDRPEGRLVWLHAANEDAGRAQAALARRLAEGGLAVLATGPVPLDAPVPGLLRDVMPAESQGAVRGFLGHWRPDALVATDGELRPVLAHEAVARGIPLLMAEARAPRFPAGRSGWFPGLMRATLGAFARIYALDEPAARAFRKAGAVPDRVTATGRMEQPSAALPCTEAERAALASLLATRPVWLAAALPEAEEAHVIEAHRTALRHAHRLLLIVAPDNPARAQPLADRMEQVEGWIVARRASEEEPDPDVQVLMADGTAELGLWLRLSPKTYLGGSLTAGCLCDPMAPAALGSAIVHGPRSGVHGAALGRIAAAQASALVGSAADLAEAVAELLAPDRAARLAQAAWGVASEGAEVTDRITADLRALVAGRS
ncbi:MAG TPA: glycosyltransferase N-terminal domain-containing protein [Paracoccaceae bacterium]|nr:glycosyltransferase N-terminal domain-containing protein [Paracoccaceae bacterium]HMO73502.1 glycosyltransferase N-terminal domain-containing protein [Paracoccaceae bacterium]